MTEKHDVLKLAGDVAATSVTVATLFQWLPAIAALFAIIWYGINVTEKVTGKPFSELMKKLW